MKIKHHITTRKFHTDEQESDIVPSNMEIAESDAGFSLWSSRVVWFAPIALVVLATSFLLSWKKHPLVLKYKDHNTREKIHQKISSYTFIYDKKSSPEYLRYHTAYGLRTMFGDTLTIRFTKRILTNISSKDYDHQKYALNLGYMECLKQGQWYPLHYKMSKSTDFIVPLSVKDGNMDEWDETVFLEFLPAYAREDEGGNRTRVIERWKNK